MVRSLKGRLFIAVAASGLLTPVFADIGELHVERGLRYFASAITSDGTNAGQGIVVGDDGIPIVDYGGAIGRQLNPVTVSQSALDHWESLMNGDSTSTAAFVNCADWLIEHMNDHGTYATLDYQFPWPTYGMVPPWRSGMAQGRALEVLIRVHQIRGEDRYLTAARKLTASFYVAVDSGGVTYKSEEGWWYEEYAMPHAVPSYVLNGMMFAILALHEYGEYIDGDSNIQFLIEKGVDAVAVNLHKYDHGGDSNYDRLGERAGKSYHAIHIDQLHKLYRITGNEIFATYHDRWARFARSPLAVREIVRPTKPGLAVLGTTWLALFTGAYAVLLLAGLRGPV